MLGWATLERLWVKLDAVAIACLAAAAIPLAGMAVSGEPVYPDAAVKHISLYLVMAVSRMLMLPAASSAGIRRLLVPQIVLVLLLSFITDRGGVWDGGTRHSGLFINPNNLALTAFLLLFFVDRRRDPMTLQISIHALLIAVLAWSRTSGAVVAYGIGLALHFGALLSRPWRLLAGTLLSMCGVAALAVLAFTDQSLLPESRLTAQISVISTQLNTVLEGREVAYYEQERVLGPGSGSAIWRLAHWRRTIMTYAAGSPAQQLFGFGLGSSPVLLGKVPHNEYLRVLFEQGLAGLALFGFAFIGIYKTAAPEVRYCALIIAIYSFSENNLENFPFMMLFVLCLSAVPALRKTA